MRFANVRHTQRAGSIALAILTAVGPTTLAAAWASGAEEESTPFSEIGHAPPQAGAGDGDDGEKPSDQRRFEVLYQIGAHYQLNEDQDPGAQDTDPWLFTASLAGLFGQRTHNRWGVGAHLSYGDGLRLGFKGLWRTPLTMTQSAYFQFAPGIYVYADEGNDRYDYTATWHETHYEYQSLRGHLDLPAFFCEAELGFSNKFALVAAMEALPYDWTTKSGPYGGDSAVSQSRELDWNFYAGVKIGQGYAAITTLVLAVVVGIVAASWGGLNLSGLSFGLSDWGYSAF